MRCITKPLNLHDPRVAKVRGGSLYDVVRRGDDLLREPKMSYLLDHPLLALSGYCLGSIGLVWAFCRWQARGR